MPKTSLGTDRICSSGCCFAAFRLVVVHPVTLWEKDYVFSRAFLAVHILASLLYLAL